MLLEIRNASASRGGQKVLSDFTFYIKGTEKIGVVGRNGAGKSTLLSVIGGSLSPDLIDGHPESRVRFSRAVTTALFSQVPAPEDLEKTPEDFIREAAEYQKIPAESPLFSALARDFSAGFTRLGFALEDRKKRLSEFSGGEMAKILLLRLFLVQPDILLLDEPTNHLDMDTVQWLEEAVRKYPKAVVTVSHDRYFLDETSDVIWEVSGGKLTRYPGSYTDFRAEKTKRQARLTREYQAQQEEIRRLNDLILKFRGKPRKAAFARTRANLLKKMEVLEKPEPDEARIHTEPVIPEHMGSKNVLDCDKLVIGYGKDRPLRTVFFRLKRGQKIGIFGPNGTGKSTFLKTLAGKVPPLSGRLSVSESAEIACFDQMSAELASEKCVYDYFHDRFPVLTGREVRQILAGYLFMEKDMGKKVSLLSGGEKARLVLAVLLQRRPNVLLLDEPTNNMDIPAKETLESIFRQYQGTLVFISHDRYFLSHVAEELLYFPPDTDKVLYCPFGYEHFKKRQAHAAGEDMDAMRDAEQQRMIEDLRAVPRGSSMGLREVSTASLQLDWEFSLNREKRKPAEEAFIAASEAYEKVPETEEEYESRDEERLCEELEKARDKWTEELLGWYGIWTETE